MFMVFLVDHLLDLTILAGEDGSILVSSFVDSAYTVFKVVLWRCIITAFSEKTTKDREEIISTSPDSFL